MGNGIEAMARSTLTHTTEANEPHEAALITDELRESIVSVTCHSRERPSHATLETLIATEVFGIKCFVEIN